MYSKHVLKSSKISIVATIVSATLSSLSLSFIPFAVSVEKGHSDIFAYIIAAFFWGGLLSTFIASQATKRILRRLREKMIIKGCLAERQPIGVASFSKDWRMWILYGTTFLGLVLMITDIILDYIPEIIMFPVISVTILTFAIHCVVDGRYYKAYQRIKESVNNETNC